MKERKKNMKERRYNLERNVVSIGNVAKAKAAAADIVDVLNLVGFKLTNVAT